MSFGDLLSRVRRYTEVANDAALPPLGDPQLQGGDRFFSLASGTLFTVVGAPGFRSFVVSTAGAGAFAIPLHQIPFGTGPGVTSSPRFIWDPTLSELNIQDIAGLNVVQIIGAPLARGFFAYDSAGSVLFQAGSSAGGRNVSVFDATGNLIESVDADPLVRQWSLTDSTPVVMQVVDTKAANRTSTWFNSAAAAIRTLDTKSGATCGETWSDGAQPVSKMSLDPAARAGLDQTGRGQHWYDAAGVLRCAMRSDPVLANNFMFRLFDQAGNYFVNAVTQTAFRQWSFLDITGNFALVQFVTAVASPQFNLGDDAGHNLLTCDLRTAQRVVTFKNEAGASILEIDQTAATAKTVIHVPIVLGSFTLAAANALSAAQGKMNGAIIFGSDVRVGAEGPGAGTGSMIQYKTGGVGSPAWFMPDGVTVAVA